MSKIIQISQLLATPDGQYVNGEIHAFVRGIKPPFKQGAPSKGELSDSTGSISASFWGGGVDHWEGKQVVLSGKGMKITEYKGTKALSVGDKVDIRFGGAPGAAAQGEAFPGDPVPAVSSGSYGQPPVQTPPARPMPQNGPRTAQEHLPVNLPHGATVGASINKAVDIWIATKQPESGWTDSSATLVEKWARQLLEIHGAMERGEPPVNIPF